MHINVLFYSHFRLFMHIYFYKYSLMLINFFTGWTIDLSCIDSSILNNQRFLFLLQKQPGFIGIIMISPPIKMLASR